MMTKRKLQRFIVPKAATTFLLLVSVGFQLLLIDTQHRISPLGGLLVCDGDGGLLLGLDLHEPARRATDLVRGHRAQRLAGAHPALGDQGVELRGDDTARALVPEMSVATEEDWYAEYLAPVLAIRVVDGLDQAVALLTGGRHVVPVNGRGWVVVVPDIVRGVTVGTDRRDGQTLLIDGGRAMH